MQDRVENFQAPTRISSDSGGERGGGGRERESIRNNTGQVLLGAEAQRLQKKASLCASSLRKKQVAVVAAE